MAANPTDTSRLRLDEEVSAIEEELLKVKFRDKFNFQQKHAVKVDALSQHLLQVEPDIVHFSGHGSRTGQITLENAHGTSHPVDARALSNLFSVLKDNIRCVVLNACYSEVQAKPISKHIDCVIGMSKAIGDEAAIKFSQGFYRGIGFGKDVETAFKLGCNQIDLQGLNEQTSPQILWKNGKPTKIIFTQPVPDSNSSLNTHDNSKLEKPKSGIVYCDICGSLPGEKTPCLVGYLRHNFISK